MCRSFRFSLFAVSILSAVLASMPATAGAKTFDEIAAEIERIDDDMSGNLGVYIKRLSDGRELRHRADRPWYLASTIKIPLAIVVLQKVESGELTLDHEIELAESDYVDGTGKLLYAEPGDRFRVVELIRHSIENSDSTATDMLIRLIGEDEFNRQIRDNMANGGIGRITTILQVRHDAYSEVHARARQLNNMDFMDLKAASDYSERYARLLDKLDLEPDKAAAAGIGEAFEKYYRRGLNSGTLTAMGHVLERLVDGELLNPENTRRLLGYMANVTTGDYRIKAGLPADAVFAHKTGTQVRRACNVGVVNPFDRDKAVVVAACTEAFADFSKAEQALARVGKSLEGLWSGL